MIFVIIQLASVAEFRSKTRPQIALNLPPSSTSNYFSCLPKGSVTQKLHYMASTSTIAPQRNLEPQARKPRYFKQDDHRSASSTATLSPSPKQQQSRDVGQET